MASFEEHIQKAKSNLKFLEDTNSKNQSYWDWQVTTIFYTAVHVVNAHLAQIGNLHYRTHEDVKNAINPHRPLAIGAVSEQIYLCYTKLEGLSRRSRYLCHDNPDNQTIVGQLTQDRHFTKAIRKLDPILEFFSNKYSLSLSKIKVQSPELSSRENLKFFLV